VFVVRRTGRLRCEVQVEDGAVQISGKRGDDMWSLHQRR
jgi:hypothetical protein